MAPMELEAYFAKQLEEAGWDVSRDLPMILCLEQLLLPELPPAPEWHGSLSWRRSTRRRSLSLRAERPGQSH